MALSEKYIVCVEDLTVQYGVRTIFSHLSTTIAPSEVRVILGPSGCGKSTFLKALIGLLKPAHGKVWLFGSEIKEQDDPTTVDVLKKVGVLFQNGALFGSLSVEENIALPLQIHTALPKQIIKEIVDFKLSQVDLPNTGRLYPSELSGGMRKRVGLARALALDPPLLFCDEPSAGLDPVTSAGLDVLLLKLRETLGITVVVVTHELLSIETIADTISFLHKGSLVFDGPYSEARKLESGPVNDFFARRQNEPAPEIMAQKDYFVEMTQ